jgi:hypothetical protein
MPSPSTNVAVSYPFSSLNLHPCLLGDHHAICLIDEEESGCPENIPSQPMERCGGGNDSACSWGRERSASNAKWRPQEDVTRREA